MRYLPFFNTFGRTGPGPSWSRRLEFSYWVRSRGAFEFVCCSNRVYALEQRVIHGIYFSIFISRVILPIVVTS
jgi:hypothetical protein